MQKISFDQITKTYNGKRGCACGCNGTYSLPSHVSIEAANKETGYNAYDNDSVSDRRCKIALKKINDAIVKFGPLTKTSGRNGEYNEFSGKDDEGNAIWFCYNDNFAAVDINNRSTTVYFG